MADRNRIQEVLNRYAWGQDQGELDVVSDCLTETAVLSINTPGDNSPSRFEGKQAVLEHLKAEFGGRSEPARHLVSNVFLEEDGNAAATVVSYITVASVGSGSPKLVATAWSRDRVVFDSGKWRIAERQLMFDTA